jgi:hypothetical protein
MGLPVRGEMWNLALALESTYGTDPGTAKYVLFPGTFQNVTMPDPATDFNAFWLLGNNSYRNWYIAYKGRRTAQGSIPETLLLNGTPLFLPIGTQATIGGVVAQNSGLFVAASRGDTTIPVFNSAANFISGQLIQVGSGTTAEVRRISTIPTSGTVTVTQPLRFNHASGERTWTTSSPYTHTVTESVSLDSLAMHVTQYDTSQTSKLMRRFLGGKVGRASIACREGEYLTMSFDDLSFTGFSNDQTGEDGYSAGVADVTPVYPTTQPYLFSYGSLTLNGTVFARVRAFRLEVSNNLIPKYYVSMSGQVQLPSEYREGQRQYRLSVDIDIEDAALYKELIRQGTYTSVYKGFQAIFAMTRGTNDTITITTPPAAPAAGGNAMGCLINTGKHDIQSSEPLTHVTLDIICRSIGIVIVDSIPYLPE